MSAGIAHTVDSCVPIPAGRVSNRIDANPSSAQLCTEGVDECLPPQADASGALSFAGAAGEHHLNVGA